MPQVAERFGDPRELLGWNGALDDPAELLILSKHVGPQQVAGVPEAGGRRMAVGRDRGDLVREPALLRSHRRGERMVRATMAAPRGEEHLLLRLEARRAGAVPEEQQRTAVIGGRTGVGAPEAAGEGESLGVLIGLQSHQAALAGSVR